MAIDTKSLTDIITEFRALQSKDAVSPESLGYILQRIVDLLATAGTSETVSNIQKLLDGFKAAGQAITELSQGQADRNHIYADKKTVNLATGAVASSSGIFIQQATTERAGAMRAQQVVDLNTAKKNISELQSLLTSVQSEIEKLKGSSGASSGGGLTPISVQTEGDRLYVLGAQNLIVKGFIPYLFRQSRKRSRFNSNDKEPTNTKKYCRERRGWNLFGSCYTVKMDGNKFTFNAQGKSEYTIPSSVYSDKPETLVTEHTTQSGVPTVAWGSRCVRLIDPHNSSKRRMIRLRFAIGFGPETTPGRVRITPASLVTNLAEFSLVYDPKLMSWSFSK